MIIAYARVSTDAQDHALQLDALKAAGCTAVWTETASGSRTDRPELRKLLEQARTGDTIVVCQIRRPGYPTRFHRAGDHGPHGNLSVPTFWRSDLLRVPGPVLGGSGTIFSRISVGLGEKFPSSRFCQQGCEW